MKKNDLIKILRGDIFHINKIHAPYIGNFGIKVTVSPIDIKKMLLKYLEGKISTKNIAKWALFLCTRSEYVSPLYANPSLDYYLTKRFDEVDWTYYKDMWLIVEGLSTIKGNEPIEKEQMKRYFTLLRKIF